MLCSRSFAREITLLLLGGAVGCGYIGVEEVPLSEQPLTDAEFSGGTGAKTQIGEGGADPIGVGAKPGTGGDEPISGGAPGSGGRDGTGGTEATGGVDGSGGAGTGGGPTEVPGYPCSTDCADPFRLFRTFEIGVPVTPFITGGGRVDRSTETVHGDMYSLAVTQGTPGSETELAEAIVPVTDGELYLRTWLYVPQGGITDWIKILGINGTPSSNIDVTILSNGAIEVFSHAGMLSSSSDGGAFPSGEWLCLQVDTVVSDDAGKVSVRVNGAPVVSQSNVDTRPLDGVSRIVYGVGASGSAQAATTIYWDDLAVSTEPISCD